MGLNQFWTLKGSEVTPSCPTLWDFMYCSLPSSSIHGIFPGKNTRVGCHFLLQGIFLTQGSKPGLLHSRQTLYPLSHQGILNWKQSVFSFHKAVLTETLMQTGLPSWCAGTCPLGSPLITWSVSYGFRVNRQEASLMIYVTHAQLC